MEFDALGVLITATLAVYYGQTPWWYLSLGLARYLFVLGLWWRAKHGRPIYSLTPSTTRRLMAGFCMGFGTVLLWPIVRPPATVLGGIVLTVPFLAGFLRDWLVVSGQIDPAAPAYLAARRKLALIVTYWLPVILRLLAAFIAISFIAPSLRSTASLTAAFTWPGLPWSALLAPLIGWLGLVAAGPVVLGLLGRLAALGLVIPAMTNILNAGLRLDNGLLLVAALMLLLFGTGAFSLWRPEETWLNRRPGEKR
jgi:CDP-diacylglycerol---glycerol-3-phosphate 3-phosphatidyltransferase